jgi:hypothetical protein
MRIGFDRRQIVDGDDFDVAAFRLNDGAQNIAADSAEPVNCYTHGHFPGLLFRKRPLREPSQYQTNYM